MAEAAPADPLGAALAEEVLAELRTPATPERDAYLGVMVTALKAHILRAPAVAGPARESMRDR
jgi:AraC family transcriptional regulator